jgi:competence protein ComEC
MPDGNIDIWFLDVGEGDASLIEGPSGTTILIDGGPDGTVLAELGIALPFYERTIDMVILTHPDLDHLSGLVDVLERYTVRTILMSNRTSSSETYKAFLAEIKKYHIPYMEASEENDLLVDNRMYVDVLHPFVSDKQSPPQTTNDTSVVTRVTFGTVTALFTGDIGETVEESFIERKTPLSSQILKVSHHGSHLSSTAPFLAKVSPELAVISVGAVNRYGHPRAETIERLKNAGADVYLTSLSSRLHVKCTPDMCYRE